MKKLDLSDEYILHPDNKKVLIWILILSIITLVVFHIAFNFTIKSNPKLDTLDKYYVLLNILLITATGAIGIAGLSGLFLPYFKNRDLRIYRKFNSMYFEVRYFAFPLILAFATYICVIMFFTIHPGFGYETLLSFANDNPRFYLVSLPICYFTLLYSHLAGFSIKTSFKEGFIDTILSKTLFGNFLFYIQQRISRFFDMKNYGKLTNRTYIMYFLGGLLLFYLVMNSIFSNSAVASLFVGIIALYLFWRTLLFRQRADFLRKETDKISEGNYNLNIDKNLGILNPLADSICEIKNGLERVVKEEVKSTRTKAELITNVSHDLKTPLTSILSYSDLITRDEIDSEKKKQYAEIIHQKSLRLKTLIDDIFEMTKMTSGNIELKKNDLNLSELFGQVLGEHMETFKEKKLDLIVSEFSGEIYASLDGEKTFRIFDNIFSNIEKYALRDTRVYIDLSYDPVRQQMIFFFKNIANYKMDFSPEELTGRFKRGDTSRQTEGSGLGLSIAKSLLEIQGGNIKMEVDGDLFKTRIQLPTLYKKA